MSFYSFRDRPRLSERMRGKSGDELFNELRKELDQDSKSFFDRPSSNWGTSTGSSFPRSGHLFEEPLMRGHTDIRSHLEDLAHRHPEFADQLRYPAWSNEGRANTWGRKRRGSEQKDAGEASKQQQQESSHSQSEDGEEPGPLRGRPKENLRNTVPDMGQKQQQETEDRESRGQRSWSAPPDNRTQQQERPRFVSKIEINPVNPDAPQTQTGDATKPPMAPPKPQPQPQHQPQQQAPPQQQPKQSNVRHIPIFVEGRDEPVLPKNVEPEFTQTQAPPQQHFSRPQPQPHYNTSHLHRTQTPPHFEPQHEPPQQPKPQPPPQPKAQPPSPPPQHPEHTQPESHSQNVNPRDPLFKVECVQKEVDELKNKVENFSGNTRSDKEYILLDEMLTRNLIKLDDIETDGKEEVRAARKNTIKSIQRCISVLENKVPVPGSEKKGVEAMEVEQSSEMASSETNEKSGEATSNQPSSNNQLDASTQPPMGEENQALSAKNVSGDHQVSSAEEKKEESSEGVSNVPPSPSQNKA